MDRNLTAHSDWVAYASDRKDYDSLEWMAIYFKGGSAEPSLAASNALARADAPQWIRGAVLD
jgi:hypothetical protein